MITYKNVKRPLEEYIAPLPFEQIGKTYDTLQQGHIKALELRNQLETAVANLDMDPSEDGFKSQLVNDIGRNIDNNAVEGNMYYSIPEIIKQQGNITKNPAIIGRIKANAKHKAFLESLEKMEIDDDIKAMAKELSPYYYEDKKDENGNIIGGSDWEPIYKPVKQIDFAKRVGEWIKLASPDEYQGTSVTFMDSNGNISSNYTPGSDALVFSEITGKTEKLSPEKLMAAITFGIQNTPGAMASLQQDMKLGLWKAEKISGDTPEDLQMKIAASNGVLDSKGQIKSFNQYLSDRINPAIYAKQYYNTYNSVKYHNDALKQMHEARTAKELALNGGGNGNVGNIELPYNQGPVHLAEDTSVSESYNKLSYLNGTIADKLRDLGIPEKELKGNLWADYNKISDLISKYSPKSQDILKDIKRDIDLYGADISYYNSLHSQEGYTDEEIQALDYKAAIDGNYSPNDLNFNNDNKFTQDYNKRVNKIYGNSDKLVYVNNAKVIDNIISEYGDRAFIDAGFKLETTQDGKKQIVIPKEIAYKIPQLTKAITNNTQGFFKNKGYLARFDESTGSYNKLYDGGYDRDIKPETRYSTISYELNSVYNKTNKINQNKEHSISGNKVYETPTQVSPTATPFMYYLDSIILNSPDKNAVSLANTKKKALTDVLENEISNLNIINSDYSVIDENGVKRKISSKEKKKIQMSYDKEKEAGLKLSANNASIITIPWTGESYTYITLPLDGGKEYVRLVLDDGHYNEEFNKLNNSASRKISSDLYQSSYTNKPIQVGFDNNSKYFIEFAGKIGEDNYYNLTIDGESVVTGLTADEAQKYVQSYYQLLSLGEQYKNGSVEDKNKISAAIPEYTEIMKGYFGRNTEEIIKSIIGL